MSIKKSIIYKTLIKKYVDYKLDYRIKAHERDIEILNQKYTNLIIQQTMAMIEEKKQLPKLNIISEPFSDTSPYSPSLINILFVVLIINLGLYLSRTIHKVSSSS